MFSLCFETILCLTLFRNNFVSDFVSKQFYFLICYVTIGVCVIVGYFIQWPVDVNLKMTKAVFFIEITLKYYAPFILDEFFQIVKKNNWTEIFFRGRKKLFLKSGKTFWIAKYLYRFCSTSFNVLRKSNETVLLC